METFLNDINGIHGDIVEAELNAEKLIAVGSQNEYFSLVVWPNEFVRPSINGEKNNIRVYRVLHSQQLSGWAPFVGISECNFIWLAVFLR